MPPEGPFFIMWSRTLMRRSLINEWLKAKEDEKHIDYNFLESVPYVNGKTLVQYNCIRDLAPFCGHFNSSFV